MVRFSSLYFEENQGSCCLQSIVRAVPQGWADGRLSGGQLKVTKSNRTLCFSYVIVQVCPIIMYEYLYKPWQTGLRALTVQASYGAVQSRLQRPGTVSRRAHINPLDEETAVF